MKPLAKLLLPFIGLIVASSPVLADPPAITSATANATNTVLTVVGTTLSAQDPHHPLVAVLDGMNLTITSSSATGLTANLPSGLAPGTYRLYVDTAGNISDQGHLATLDVTLPATGPQGATGATGPAGANGVNGAAGATGATGAAGANGATGSPGANGMNGAPGAPGATGMNGAPGAPGATGMNGAPGATGATGTNGAPGATGPAGPSGSKGATGATGSQGPSGAQGVAGAQGPTGAQGPQGPSGTQGVAGTQGPTGAQGSQGPTGAQGQQGPIGPTGPAGGGGLSVFPVISMVWSSSPTAISNPVDGQIGCNNADPAGDVTQIWSSFKGTDHVDYSTLFNSFSFDVGGYLVIRNVSPLNGSPGNILVFPLSRFGYNSDIANQNQTIDCTAATIWLGSGFADGDQVIVSFLPPSPALPAAQAPQ